MKVKSESEVVQSCLTLSDPMDCSLPGSSIHGTFQARVLEWGAIAFSDSEVQPQQFLKQEGLTGAVGPYYYPEDLLFAFGKKFPFPSKDLPKFYDYPPRLISFIFLADDLVLQDLEK